MINMQITIFADQDRCVNKQDKLRCHVRGKPIGLPCGDRMSETYLTIYEYG